MLPTLADAERMLRKHFGYPSFRPGQRRIIESLLAGRDTMGIMPTGGGKSVCYQIPALLFPGITVVISPLISLMKDQVDRLLLHGIPATFLNSTLSPEEADERIRRLMAGEYKLLYIAPERLESERFHTIFQRLPVDLVTVDEAHCISQWGHDFRPSYRTMAEKILGLPKKPLIMALTATATPDVREDITSLLGIPRDAVHTMPVRRNNLSFFVRREEDRTAFIRSRLARSPDKTGIIYCSTRKEVDKLYTALQSAGVAAARYHAGMDEREREHAQERFARDQVQVIVATNAFGMGIDKSNVRFVIHHNLPRNLESYYQEAGRAGRDGEPGECILLWNPGDMVIQRHLIDQSGLSPERKELERDKLRCMVRYAVHTDCLQVFIARYFGEEEAEPCGLCGPCRSVHGEKEDVTGEALKIFSCVKRMGERFGLTLLSKTLRGSKNIRLKQFGLDRLSTYGIMNDRTEKEIRHLCHRLLAEGYLAQTDEEELYPTIRLTAKAVDVLKGKRRALVAAEETHGRESSERPESGLYDILRELRKEIAEREQIPPYVIFHDSTLREMCRRLPVTPEQFRAIPGVGEAKLARYGQPFLDKIRTFVRETAPGSPRRPKPGPSSRPEAKVPTHVITWNMWRDGKSVEEIARLRNLKRGTIEDHLFRCGMEGFPLDWSTFIPAEHEARIMQAIERLGAHKLRPIKEALPEEVSYMAIKAAVAKREMLLRSKPPVTGSR
ncbi:DNA helicase RecQ [Staphylospora marina]|uniref:DNA helicase RecQ n=1 Tax=Staphylospora marina TaxID=2490858 RepID=UPI000F5B9D80|nr:DNA helicase RecQ [Staphylospora marina]